ncbi:hypothetical protein ACFWGD_07500 [Corynebacterium sp. NPDC060344]|uniref:hypothetical protein n=1 Tax=Corynebacterium sp. NPDC060344 TaxID=3347101 RepID=UPI0036602DE6
MPPAFGRGSVTAPAGHELPGAHGPGPRPIQGVIQPRRPATEPVPAPIPMAGVNPYQAPPAPEPGEVVRRRAVASRTWAMVTAVLFGLAALATWGSYQSPGGSPLMSLLLGPLSSILYFCAVVASGVLGAYAIATLRALAERARRWQPPLARSHKTIGAMHLWPGRNVMGPVVILAETGVRGHGKWAWFASCALWPAALLSVFPSNSAVGVFQTGVLATLAAVASALTAAALARALAPPDPRRMVPGQGALDDAAAAAFADADAAAEPFWSRGLIAPQRRAAPTTIVPPIDDAITSLYRDLHEEKH